MKIPKEDDFTVKSSPDQIGGVFEFIEDDEIDELGTQLVSEFPEFSHIVNLEPRISFLWKRKGGTKGKKRNFSNVFKCSPVVRFFARTEYVVWVAADHAFNMGFDDQKIEAALFRALKRLQLNKQVKEEQLSIVADEFSGSYDEMLRYGAWFQELQDMSEKFQQLPLFKGKTFKRKKGSAQMELVQDGVGKEEPAA